MNLARLLVIFDLDETLLRATTNPTLEPADFIVEAFRVRRRPHLEDLLRRVARFADIAVWSSGTETYVEAMLRQSVPADIALRFVWARSRCTRRYDDENLEEYWVKDLKKVKRLGYALERILIVDDSPEKTERNYGNHIGITPFLGDQADRELAFLATYLERFEHIENVRTVEKRGWHLSMKKGEDS